MPVVIILFFIEPLGKIILLICYCLLEKQLQKVKLKFASEKGF